MIFAKKILVFVLFVGSCLVPAHGFSDETELSVVMEDMVPHAKLLGTQLLKNPGTPTPEDLEAILNSSDKIQGLVARGMMMVPTKVSKVEDAKERRKEQLAYQKIMSALLTAFADMEIQLLDGDFAAARQFLTQAFQLRGEGHERFREKE